MRIQGEILQPEYYRSQIGNPDNICYILPGTYISPKAFAQKAHHRGKPLRYRPAEAQIAAKKTPKTRVTGRIPKDPHHL